MHAIFIVQIVIATVCVFGIILNALRVTFYLPNIPTGNSYSSYFTDEKPKFSEQLHFEGRVWNVPILLLNLYLLLLHQIPQ